MKMFGFSKEVQRGTVTATAKETADGKEDGDRETAGGRGDSDSNSGGDSGWQRGQ